MGKTKQERELFKSYEMDGFKFDKAQYNSNLRHEEAKKEDVKKIKNELSEAIFKELQKYGDFEFTTKSYAEGHLEILVTDKTGESRGR